jgi:hypothetical protein
LTVLYQLRSIEPAGDPPDAWRVVEEYGRIGGAPAHPIP